jgi:catechol 2,3-dioxygenase-like lactoylglutathione lyase family enzyme
MKAEDLYHVGIVVDDLDASLKWFSDVAGYRWCDQFAGEQTVETPNGEVTVPIRFAYSMSEPRLEVLQSVPDTLWVPADSGVHHVGYWSDDLDADIGALEANGLEVEVRAPMPDGTSLWAYCKGTTGPRVELVSRLIEPTMTERFKTGRSPQG